MWEKVLCKKRLIDFLEDKKKQKMCKKLLLKTISANAITYFNSDALISIRFCGGERTLLLDVEAQEQKISNKFRNQFAPRKQIFSFSVRREKIKLCKPKKSIWGEGRAY